MRALPLVTLAAVLAAGGPAAAHVTLEAKEAFAGSYHRATLKVPHGCQGSPTVRVRLRLPAQVTAAKPMPKPGWELQIVRQRMENAIRGAHGEMIVDRVSEIVWSGGPLADAHYDEFVLQVVLPNTPGEVLAFPVVQECAQGVHRWIQLPEAGKSGSDLKEPAPLLRLLPRP
jgi:uncharacterized protein YcnI